MVASLVEQLKVRAVAVVAAGRQCGKERGKESG